MSAQEKQAADGLGHYEITVLNKHNPRLKDFLSDDFDYSFNQDERWKLTFADLGVIAERFSM